MRDGENVKDSQAQISLTPHFSAVIRSTIHDANRFNGFQTIFGGLNPWLKPGANETKALNWRAKTTRLAHNYSETCWQRETLMLECDHLLSRVHSFSFETVSLVD